MSTGVAAFAPVMEQEIHQSCATRMIMFAVLIPLLVVSYLLIGPTTDLIVAAAVSLMVSYALAVSAWFPTNATKSRIEAFGQAIEIACVKLYRLNPYIGMSDDEYLWMQARSLARPNSPYMKRSMFASFAGYQYEETQYPQSCERKDALIEYLKSMAPAAERYARKRKSSVDRWVELSKTFPR